MLAEFLKETPDEIFVYICKKCEGVTIFEAPYAIPILDLPCENCKHETHMLAKHYVR